MPHKVDDVELTMKVVKSLIARGPASVRKLARIAGTTSPRKIRQIAKISGTASYLLADRAVHEISKLPLNEDQKKAIKKALMIPNVIEVKDGPDMVDLEPLTVHESRLSISPEVARAVSESGVVSPASKGKTLTVTFGKKPRGATHRKQ